MSRGKPKAGPARVLFDEGDPLKEERKRKEPVETEVEKEKPDSITQESELTAKKQKIEKDRYHFPLPSKEFPSVSLSRRGETIGDCLVVNGRELGANIVRYQEYKFLFFETPVSIFDYLHMLIQEKSFPVVISLTHIGDMTRLPDLGRLPQYEKRPGLFGHHFTQNDEKLLQPVEGEDAIRINVSQESEENGVLNKTVVITQDGHDLKRVYQHLIYKNWPDMKRPESPEALKSIYNMSFGKGVVPCAIHCKGGLVRSVTMAAHLVLTDLAKRGEVINEQRVDEVLEALKKGFIKEKKLETYSCGDQINFLKECHVKGYEKKNPPSPKEVDPTEQSPGLGDDIFSALNKT